MCFGMGLETVFMNGRGSISWSQCVHSWGLDLFVYFRLVNCTWTLQWTTAVMCIGVERARGASRSCLAKFWARSSHVYLATNKPRITHKLVWLQKAQPLTTTRMLYEGLSVDTCMRFMTHGLSSWISLHWCTLLNMRPVYGQSFIHPPKAFDRVVTKSALEIRQLRQRAWTCIDLALIFWTAYLDITFVIFWIFDFSKSLPHLSFRCAVHCDKCINNHLNRLNSIVFCVLYCVLYFV